MGQHVQCSFRCPSKNTKKIVCIITYSPYLAHTDELFKNLNILPIHKLMLQRVSLQMFKYSQNILPEVIGELFITNDTFHSHNTRNKNKLRSKMSNREYNLCTKTLAL